MKLFAKLLRGMKQSAGQMTAYMLIIAVGAFFYTGLVTYSDQMSTYVETYFQDHHLSDLNVSYRHISSEEITALSDIKGINRIEGRYTFAAHQSFDGGKASLTMHSIPENNQINIPKVMEGRIPNKKDEVLLDSHYADEHQYQIGDDFRIQANGDTFTFRISGLGEDVEYAKINETQDHQKEGFAYMSEAAIPQIAGSFTFNDVMIEVVKGTNMDKLEQTIHAQSEQRNLSYIQLERKERTFNYSQTKDTIYNNKMMSRVIPFVLFLIEAIILFLSMSRMIDSERNQVGIMKALGIKNKNIMLHYMGYPVFVSIIGSLIGCVVADLVFIPLVTESNANSYSFPGVTYSLSYVSVIPPILVSSFFGILACYLSGRTILKERAAQAMRPRPPKRMKQLWVEKIPGFWSRISYSHKIIIRNILLNKQKSLASSIGIVVSSVLLITAFGTEASLIKVANQMEDAYNYDFRVNYSEDSSADKHKIPPGLNKHYDVASYPVQLIKGDSKQKATLVITEQENDLIHFFDENENQITLNNNGVLVPKSYADKYNISAGDTIQVEFTNPELQNQTVDMSVSAISTQYSEPSFYGTPTYLKSFDIAYQPDSLMVQAAQDTELKSVRGFFERDQQVDQITDKRDLKELAEYTLKQNTFVFVMFIICAIILSFGAIYTISSINIYERNRELATLKVLGYSKHKINRLIFLENIILTVIAVIVALPISSYFYSVIVGALSSPHQQIPDQLNIVIVFASIIVAFLLTIISNLLLRRKVAKINMIESLKSLE